MAKKNAVPSGRKHCRGRKYRSNKSSQRSPPDVLHVYENFIINDRNKSFISITQNDCVNDRSNCCGRKCYVSRVVHRKVKLFER